jgi:hypothetical protein
MRILLDIFNSSFEGVSRRSRELLQITTDRDLFQKPRELPQTFAMFSMGEYILRSAAAVEQTFGGITRRLWDDPFEWTLPEKLSSVALVSEYLAEVDAARVSGFSFLSDDDSLRKTLPAPIKIQPIAEVLTDTLLRAEHFQGRAYAIHQMLSDEKLPKV